MLSSYIAHDLVKHRDPYTECLVHFWKGSPGGPAHNMLDETGKYRFIGNDTGTPSTDITRVPTTSSNRSRFGVVSFNSNSSNSSNNIVVKNYLFYKGLTTLMVDFWWNRNIDNDHQFCFTMNQDFNQFYVWMSGGDQLDVWSGTDCTNVNGASVSDDTWYHFCAILRNGGNVNTNIRIYVDGVKVDDNSFGQAAGSGSAGLLTFSDSFAIGGINTTAAYSNSEYYIDEFRLTLGSDRGWWDGFPKPTAPHRR